MLAIIIIIDWSCSVHRMHSYCYVPRLAHMGCNMWCAAVRRWITWRWSTLTSCWDLWLAIWLTVIWQTSNGYKTSVSLSRWVVVEWDRCLHWHFRPIWQQLRALNHSITPFSKRSHHLKMRCLLPTCRGGRAFKELPYHQTLPAKQSFWDTPGITQFRQVVEESKLDAFQRAQRQVLTAGIGCWRGL